MAAPVEIIESGTVVEAYHGTTRGSAANILVNTFRVGGDERSWLGNGVYFYESSREHAYNYALYVKRIRPADIAVLRATIKLGRCFDLHIAEHAALAESYFDEMENKIEREHLTSHGKPIIVTPSSVIEGIARIVDFDTVRGGHALHNEPIFPGTKFRKGQQIIICVRNLNNILDVRPT